MQLLAKSILWGYQEGNEMMNDVECPYCGEGQEINHDGGYGYEEDRTHEQECGNCEKTFIFTTSISFDYEAEKADCLNGENHKYARTNTYPRIWARLQCKVCGSEKALPEAFREE